MVRLLLTILTTTALVAFGLSNTHRVLLSFVVGETEVRLIFLLLVSFASGVVTILLHTALTDARHRALTRRMRATMTHPALLPDEVE
jgi:uncharacterized integral membrane protein